MEATFGDIFLSFWVKPLIFCETRVDAIWAPLKKNIYIVARINNFWLLASGKGGRGEVLNLD